MPKTDYMQSAIDQAIVAKENHEVPVGAVIVYQGKIIAQGYNLVETTKNPLAHAELLVIQAACQFLKTPRLIGCDLYVTLEPCTMCAAAIAQARLRRIYFGAYDPKGGGVDHGVQFFNQPTCLHHPEVYGGLRANDCQQMLQAFFKTKR